MGILESLVDHERIKSFQIGKVDDDENQFELLIVWRGYSERLVWYRCIYSRETIFADEKNHDVIFDLIIKDVETSEQVLLKDGNQNVN